MAPAHVSILTWSIVNYVLALKLLSLSLVHIDLFIFFPTARHFLSLKSVFILPILLCLVVADLINLL